MSSAAREQNLAPASAAARFCWGLALTPVAGLIGFFLGMLVFSYQHSAVPPYPYPAQNPPLLEEITAFFELGLFTSLFSWPVTLVVFPLLRGRVPSRTWKAFGVLTFCGLATGFVGPIPALLMLSLIRPQNAFVWERFFPTLGAISGFLTAMPYFLLTNPRRAPSARLAGAGRGNAS